jgi:hypothetical protein
MDKLKWGACENVITLIGGMSTTKKRETNGRQSRDITWLGIKVYVCLSQVFMRNLSQGL